MKRLSLNICMLTWIPAYLWFSQDIASHKHLGNADGIGMVKCRLVRLALEILERLCLLMILLKDGFLPPM